VALQTQLPEMHLSLPCQLLIHQRPIERDLEYGRANLHETAETKMEPQVLGSETAGGLAILWDGSPTRDRGRGTGFQTAADGRVSGFAGQAKEGVLNLWEKEN
jgi:hypothetical protein